MNERVPGSKTHPILTIVSVLQAECLARLKAEVENHPEIFANADDQNSSTGDGQSTAPISSAGTPLALTTGGSNGGPGKLKLTFNNGGYTNGGGSTSGRQSVDQDDE